LAVKRKIKALCRQVEVNQPLDDLLRRVNAMLRGWCGYFRHGVSSTVFAYLRHYTWQTVWRWLRRKYRRSTWKEIRHRHCGGGWWPASRERTLFDPATVGTTRGGRPGWRWLVVQWRAASRRCQCRIVARRRPGEVRRECERDMVEIYLATLAESGVVLDRDQAWRDYCLFALDRWDAHMKTYTRGGYGHAATGVERSRLCIIGALSDNEVPALAKQGVEGVTRGGGRTAAANCALTGRHQGG
jgi:hypothetical protein